MNTATLDQFIADTKPVLRAKLLQAFRDAAGRVYRNRLADAIDKKDRTAIRTALGISPDGSSWPELETELRYILASILAPLFSASAMAAWEGLGESGSDNDVDPAALDQALTDARTTITSDALAGIEAATSLILAGTAFGLGVPHLIAAIGMTARQAQLFVASNRNAFKLRNALAGITDTSQRFDIAQGYLDKLPALLKTPLQKLISKGGGQFNDDDVRSLGKSLSRGLVDYHASAIADINTATVANLAEQSVWRAAQLVGVIPASAKKYWITRHDERVRHTHAAIEQMNADGIPIDATFANPLGRTDLYSPPAEIHCRCRVSLQQQPGATP